MPRFLPYTREKKVSQTVQRFGFILLLLIPTSVVLVLLIGVVFWWSVRNGQFDDLEGPAHRIVDDDDSSDAIPEASPEPDGAGLQANALTSINHRVNER